MNITALSDTARGSVARRIALSGGAGLLVLMTLIGAAMILVATDSTRQRVVTWVGDKTGAVADAIDAFDLTSRVLVDKSFVVFQQDYSAGFFIGPDGELLHGTEKVAGDFTHVDRFAASSGGVATVFVRQGDDFKRITTSLKTENGERAIGTLLGKTSPAYAPVLAGQTYTGPATLFGRPYMTRYEPIKTDDGKVIGILFAGIDTTAFQASVEKLIAGTRFFKTGGVYVIDPRPDWTDAVVTMHPTAHGKKLGEAFEGRQAFFAALGAAGPDALTPTPGLLDPNHRDAWALKRVSAATGLWVIAEVPDGEAMAEHWKTMVVFCGLLASAVAMLAGGLYLLLLRLIARPLRELRHAVHAVAEGDLTQGFESKRRDEIGELMRGVEGMRLRLLQTMSTLRESVESISTASREIATGNQDLSTRTEQTASSLQQAASAMEQINQTVRHSVDSAREANGLAGSASDVAARGGEVVAQVVTTMDEINASSKKIADIIGVIDGIAFQTNILALNAAVEAARAGEQGRGFAVVAGEVRSLAQRSAQAAKEIKDLIGASVEKVESGSKLVADAGQTMSEIVASVQRVSQMISEITAAAASQSSEIGQASEAVGGLDQMTQQNAALVEQSAAAAESLKDQAGLLAGVLQDFKLNR